MAAMSRRRPGGSCGLLAESFGVVAGELRKRDTNALFQRMRETRMGGRNPPPSLAAHPASYAGRDAPEGQLGVVSREAIRLKTWRRSTICRALSGRRTRAAGVLARAEEVATSPALPLQTGIPKKATISLEQEPFERTQACPGISPLSLILPVVIKKKLEPGIDRGL